MQQGGLFLASETSHFHEVTCSRWKSLCSRGGLTPGTALSRSLQGCRHSRQCMFQRSELWKSPEGKHGKGCLFFFWREVESCRMEFAPVDFAACIGCHSKAFDTLKSRRSLWIQHRVISHIKNTASTWYFVCSLVGCRLTWKTWSYVIFLFCVCALLSCWCSSIQGRLSK